MNKDRLILIEKLVTEEKIDEAQLELSRLGQEYNKSADYLYLRGKISYLNKLYYAAIDALLIALEFEQSEKIYNLDHGGYNYPLTKQLIWDGKKNKIFNKMIKLKIKVSLFHGSKDEVVPIKFSKKLLKIFTIAQKKLIIIKNGNHSLSRKNDIKKICKELDYFLSYHL